MASESGQRESPSEEQTNAAQLLPPIKTFERVYELTVSIDDRDRFDSGKQRAFGSYPNGHMSQVSYAQVFRFILDCLARIDRAAIEHGLDDDRAAALKRFQHGIRSHEPRQSIDITACPACGRELEDGEVHNHIHNCPDA